MRTLPRVVPVALGLILASCAPPATEDPELILSDGLIYPLNGDEQPVEAVAIRGDSVLALGSNADVVPLAGRYTQQMNLEDAVVLPGSYDAWVDLAALGRWPDGPLDMRLASSIEEAQAMVRNAAGSSPGDGWLLGWGWDENDWPQAVFPDRADLDRIGIERPIALLHRNTAAAWLNSAALQALADAELERYGGVVRDPTGAATGILFGDALAALDPVLADNPAQRREWVAEGARRAAAAGVTRAATAPADTTLLEDLLELEFRGLLPLRVEVRLATGEVSSYAAGDLPQQVADSALIDVAAVGLRLDGPLASRLAQLAQPYEKAGPALPPVDAEGLQAAAAAARAAGLPLHVQASGDAAVQAALAMLADIPAGGMLIGLDLLPAAAGDGLSGLRVAIAPGRFARDVYWLDRALGPERATRAYAWADLVAAGATLTLASDAPAYRLRPIGALATAMTRRTVDGYPAGGWNTAQALPRPLLLRALVGAGAGLAPGGPADLVVWSEDPVQSDSTLLHRAEALLTIVAGRVAYSRALVQPEMGDGPDR